MPPPSLDEKSKDAVNWAKCSPCALSESAQWLLFLSLFYPRVRCRPVRLAFLLPLQNTPAQALGLPDLPF